jgi:hypothetical protein
MELTGLELSLSKASPEETKGLPADLAHFLQQHDGGKGKLGARPIVLWSARQIAEENEQQEVSLAVKGLTLVGTDGGAEGYGYLARLQKQRYGRISLLAAGPHEFESLADTFEGLLQALGEGR